jgi:hypothetical protein
MVSSRAAERFDALSTRTGELDLRLLLRLRLIRVAWRPFAVSFVIPRIE